jgi:hypothetical protein
MVSGYDFYLKIKLVKYKMANPMIFIVLFLVLIVGGGAVWYFMFGPGKGEDPEEDTTAAAKAKADKVALAAAARVSDLDQEESPESIMLSSMTEEGAKDRTNREVVVPWLKFLWDAYRAVLELLHKNAKLEI